MIHDTKFWIDYVCTILKLKQHCIVSLAHKQLNNRAIKNQSKNTLLKLVFKVD